MTHKYTPRMCHSCSSLAQIGARAALQRLYCTLHLTPRGATPQSHLAQVGFGGGDGAHVRGGGGKQGRSFPLQQAVVGCGCHKGPVLQPLDSMVSCAQACVEHI